MIQRSIVVAGLAASALTFAGCDRAANTASADITTKTFFVATSEEPATIAPLEGDDPGLTALGVAKFNDLPNLSEIGAVRVFGMAGGDPAANGLKTYLAFVSPHDAQAFLLGDFREYRIVATTPGRIDLEIDEDVMGDNGELALETRRIIVSWIEAPQESSPNPTYPATVWITPAS